MAFNVLSSIIKNCQKEKEQMFLQIPLEHIEARVSYYTGYPESVIAQIQKETVSSYTHFSFFDVPERIIILKALQEFYEQQMHPTFSELYDKIKTHISITDLKQLRLLLTELGFSYHPTTYGWIICEHPKKRFERFHYLNRIIKARKRNTTIYYVDVREINENKKFAIPNSLTKAAALSENNDYVLYHVFGKNKLLHYLFTNQITTHVFEKWFSNVLVEVLKPGSLVVMDRNILYGELIDNTLTKHHSKQDMLKWAQKNNIPCDSKMHKAEIFNLLQKSCGFKSKSYRIDDILKTHGFETLHLPFRCQNLSPSQLLWNEIASMSLIEDIGNSESTLNSKEVITKVQNLCSTNWHIYESNVSEWEKEMFELDIKIEELLDKFYTTDFINFEAMFPCM